MVTIESKRWDEIPNGLETQARLLQFDKNLDWMEDHRVELLARYPDEWVVVHDGSVVAHGPRFDEVLQQLAASPASGQPVAKHFFSSKPITLLL